jgi:hypothetical protein
MIRLARRAATNYTENMASKNTTLSAINRGGIATLADGTCWHISSSELLEAKSWRIGADVVMPIPLSAER